MSGEAQKGADRGFQISDEGSMNWNEGVLAGEAAEVCFSRKGWSRHV